MRCQHACSSNGNSASRACCFSIQWAMLRPVSFLIFALPLHLGNAVVMSKLYITAVAGQEVATQNKACMHAIGLLMQAFLQVYVSFKSISTSSGHRQ